MKADLHIHSIYSDGELTPIELINILNKKGATFACLTDHDSITGSLEFIKEANKYNIKSYPALELSTESNGEPVHITCFFKSIDSIKQEFKDYLIHMNEYRKNRLRKITDNINKLYNFNINYDELSINSKCNVTRSHLSKEIQKITGLTNNEVFNKYLGNNCPGYLPSTELTILDGLKMIHDSNGIAILAHPYQLKKNDPVELLDKYNFDGVEVYYFPTPVKKYKKYMKLVKKRNLLLTGGSDYHKSNDNKHAELASFDVPDLYMDKLIERIENLN